MKPQEGPYHLVLLRLALAGLFTVGGRTALQAGRCSLPLLSPRTDPAWSRHLNLKYDGSLSNSAFSCKLRHYMQAAEMQDPDAANFLRKLRKVGTVWMLAFPG